MARLRDSESQAQNAPNRNAGQIQIHVYYAQEDTNLCKKKIPEWLFCRAVMECHWRKEKKKIKKLVATPIIEVARRSLGTQMHKMAFRRLGKVCMRR